MEPMSAVTTKAKVLICAKAYPPEVGGVEAYSEFVARAYLKAGFAVTVITSRPGPLGWTDVAYPEGVLRLKNVGGSRQAVVFWRLLGAARRTLRAESFAFVHATTWRAALALAPFRAAHKLVLTIHGKEVLGMPFYFAVPMRRMLRQAEVVVAVSPSTLAGARSVCRGEVKGEWFVAFNGLSYEAEARAFVRPIHQGPPRLYSFCRLVERKNIGGALQALRLLRDRGIENFRYVIAGSGPLKAEIAASIERLGLSDRVSLAGYLEESQIPERYGTCDVFVHPQTAPAGGTDMEGFGLVIADAMSFGALAIVGVAGGPADFVTDGDNGLVVDGLAPQAIADALASMLLDPARLDALAARGRDWALEHLSWDRHVAAILDHCRTAGVAV